MRRLLIVVFLFAGALPAASAYAGAGYAIPPDNPFVGTPGARGEVYVYGLRNPWRWSFDPGTGGMLIGDVGAGRREEVTFLPGAASRGANLGWNCREGSFAGNRCRPESTFLPLTSFAAAPTWSSAVTWYAIRHFLRSRGAICTAATRAASTRLAPGPRGRRSRLRRASSP